MRVSLTGGLTFHQVVFAGLEAGGTLPRESMIDNHPIKGSDLPQGAFLSLLHLLE